MDRFVLTDNTTSNRAQRAIAENAFACVLANEIDDMIQRCRGDFPMVESHLRAAHRHLVDPPKRRERMPDPLSWIALGFGIGMIGIACYSALLQKGIL